MSLTGGTPAVTPATGGNPGPSSGAGVSQPAPARDWFRFAIVAMQVALVVALFRLFKIENPALFNRIAPLTLVGFVIHHLLPQRMRLGFFALLSIISVFAVFAGPTGGSNFLGVSGESLKATAWLLGLGGLLIAACHVPASHAVRCGLVLAIGILFALMRIERILPATSALSAPMAIWPILGSMFMFRMVVYLYDLKHGDAPASPAHAIAYFFMLPNVLFTLFPLVDYKTFCRSHYNDDPIRIYQVGVRWVFRGVVHLLVYRQIYNNYILDPSTVTTALQAGQYILVTFALYLRLSGTFHLIVGILHLFGFNLPETHHLYFLANSFTEVWRRMNIYWKDWMQKLVFYPLFYRLKSLGKWAIPVCTLITFVITWLLHSYQWFWIRGRFPIEGKDCVFWIGLASLVLINSQWDQRKGRPRAIGAPKRTVKSEVLYGLGTIGTFTTMSLLWTLWFTPETRELKSLGKALMTMGAGEALVFVGFFVFLGTAAVLTRGSKREHTEGERSAEKRSEFPFWRYAGEVLVLGLIVGGAGWFPETFSSMPRLTKMLVDLKTNKLNNGDAAVLARGYYEDLGDVTRFNDQLWLAMGGRPKGWDFNPAQRQRDDVLEWDFQPSARVEFKGSSFGTNSFGMRDREYTKEKPPGTFRIVLAGMSHDAGSGVRDNETYENLCEDRLNRERVGSKIKSYEILNFSVGGYSPLQKLLAVEMKALDFNPDLVIYVSSFLELYWVATSMDRVMREPDSELAKYFGPPLKAAGVEPGDFGKVINWKTTNQREALLRLLYARFAQKVTQHGAKAAMLFLQVPSNVEKPPEVEKIKSMIKEQGLPILDFWGAFDSVPERETLYLRPFDDHSNPRAHVLLADRFFKELEASGLLPDPGPK